jgi:tripartite-type tricarboxylate transporter receptor subunit TctC
MCALLTHGSAALGQAYPSKPVRFLSGQPPGGATDFFARMVAQKLNETWKQPVIIEHRPGASGSIAVELTVKSPPDGHTLVFVTAGQIVINPHLLRLNYDPLVDLAPVAFLVHTCMLLVTHPSVPVKSARELVALAKAQPGKLNVGSGGNGATTHLAAELFMSLTDAHSVQGRGPEHAGAGDRRHRSLVWFGACHDGPGQGRTSARPGGIDNEANAGLA